MINRVDFDDKICIIY